MIWLGAADTGSAQLDFAPAFCPGYFCKNAK